ncbi:right-handed parallel beta-helix repeat-containing protein [Paraglaciecola chathamensis]|jgi:hypothetical protein|uniref:Right handed beta helix domain-containing protein n=1 Tax=Paraglaciecola agarilytica NO2 TaxID=1125747 RepID=A0ABQ0I2L3_9ALTE|nr:right-handed parallel beta-helix repeat-containing protein [Paraglaciecola agarilytica]GAC03570.1 hypothetical protein GAGA_0707 [Paraglaciecola agarilytica NO2]
MVSLSKIYLLRIILKLRKKVCRRLYSNMFALVILSPFTVFAQDISSSQTIIPAHDVSTLYQALQTANANGQTDIQLSPGIYRLTSTLVISAPSIRLIGDSTDPSLIRFVGRGMRSLSQVENLITVRAKHFSLDGITLTDAGNHLIQISGESGADFPVIKNCVLQDSFQQLLKVSSSDHSSNTSDYGTVQNCEFKYTQGIGPNFYIGGIDAHGARGWNVLNNVFRDIASPDNRPAEFAIHFWNGASNNVVEGNTIIDCDRGIGFGLKGKPASAGAIINNLIVHHDNNDPGADVGIILEQSPKTQILDNRVYLAHNYPNAIEYRFSETTEAAIIDNTTNKPIRKRDGATASLIGNKREKELTNLVSPDELLLISSSE